MLKMKILAITKYPPIIGYPSGVSPIDSSIQKYASKNIDILWIFDKKYADDIEMKKLETRKQKI